MHQIFGVSPRTGAGMMRRLVRWLSATADRLCAYLYLLGNVSDLWINKIHLSIQQNQERGKI